jgi:predicted nucleotidyltransferase component of viral defense system
MRDRDKIASDYHTARKSGDAQAMRRYQNEEACLVLLSLLERLASNRSSFVHEVALKGGILMAGELRSPRTSADIDATTGHQQRVDVGRIEEELRGAGREFNLRIDRAADRTTGGHLIHFRFDSLTDAGTAKLEVSIREDLVFAVRDAFFNVSELGISPFSLPAVAQVELVAEKIRTLVQRAQPRDLFDLHLYLILSGWHLDAKELRRAVDAKLALTRHRRWRPELWKLNVNSIEVQWQVTLAAWMEPAEIPDFRTTLGQVATAMHDLRLD